MTASRPSLPVVVGVDGSSSAVHAVRWAAEEASRLGAPLRVVHGYLLPRTELPYTLPSHGDVRDAVRQQAEHWLRSALTSATDVAPLVRTQVDLRTAPPISVLLELSEQARMVVVGARGLGGFAGLAVGSVAMALIAHGRCAVTVVRGPRPGARPPDYGPVVVGLNGAARADAAVALAFEEASARHAELIAVYLWPEMLNDSAFEAARAVLDWHAIEGAAVVHLRQRLASWQRKYPDVRVRQVTVRDRPVQALLTQAERAQLVVVARTPQAGGSGLLLRSTSQALVHYAPCPVVAVAGDH
ncbi:nucleotide-binding universal stress UspA family protein [Herbihabitans rhizosphaerae]|uniref:Nucleotide-binding universal stress UspA family protein n=1 Tax=Herbihabitans rhizosphaerae TaxID=1872711 RepID=A0A4Q7L697_9PSEU|nr:universal stress protein [Herbihabitans rhizosphaerae]RZS43812.1 nucleotide-binding universal stress UspA family protein [Herbihabitans rhizosphaerae]